MSVSNQKLLLIGATGATGRHALHQALDAGHEVTALVRDPARLPVDHPRLRVIVGDITDAEVARQAVAGQDAVLCYLGAPASNRDEVRTHGTAALVEAMRAEGVSRLVCLSSHGVAETLAELPWFLRRVVVPLHLGRVFADHEGQEEVVRASDLDWTLVRPPHLTNGPRTGRYRHGVGPEVIGGMKISRADVAEFTLAQLGSDAYVGRAPAVSY